MDPNQLVLDISSDDEQHPPPDAACGGGVDDDLDWLREVLESFSKERDDSDEVVVVGEYKPPLKSKLYSNTTVDDDDDDDCVILDGDPDKPVEGSVGGGGSYGDGGGVGDDDVCLIGEKGKVACRDFAHSRHLCAKFRFNSSPHERYCEMCHCYVCDSLAPCPYWGTGVSSSDHCHATDKEGTWKSMRESFRARKNGQPSVAKLIVPPPSVLVSQPNQAAFIDLRSPTSSIQQNDVTRPMAIRACSSSTRFPVPNNMRHIRSKRAAFLKARDSYSSRSVPPPALHVVGRGFKHSVTGIRRPHYASPNTMSNRLQFINNPVSIHRSVYGSSKNVNSAPVSHCSSYDRPISVSKEQQNILPSRVTESYCYYNSSQRNRGTGSADTTTSQPEVFSQPNPPSINSSTIYHHRNENQSQNVADTGFPEFDLWGPACNQSNQQTYAENDQFSGTASNIDSSGWDPFGSFIENTQLQCSDNQNTEWFSWASQSDLTPEHGMRSDPDVIAPDLPIADADLLFY